MNTNPLDKIEQRIFRIHSESTLNGGNVAAGRVRGGRQVLVGSGLDPIILHILWFDADGNLLNGETIDLPEEYRDRPYPYSDQRIKQWVVDVGFCTLGE